MPKLTAQEMMDFLAERSHLARIATVRADGSPSVVPVWFIFEGGKVLITRESIRPFFRTCEASRALRSRLTRKRDVTERCSSRERPRFFLNRATTASGASLPADRMPLRRRGVGRLLPGRNERSAAGIDRRRPRERESDDLANANRERTVFGDLGSAILRRGDQDGADGFLRDRCETQGNLNAAVRPTLKIGTSGACFHLRARHIPEADPLVRGPIRNHRLDRNGDICWHARDA